MGARCSPSRRARSQSLSCTQPGSIASSCTADAIPQTSTSALGQLPQCLSFCRPQPPNLAAANGATCAVDPCDSAAFTSLGAVVCPENWSCVPNVGSGRLGQCRRTETETFGLCEPGGTVPCPTGTYCRPFTSGAGSAFPRPSGTRYADTSRTGMCVTPMREGAACDADWAGSVTGSNGRMCEAGMNCRFMPGTTSGTRRCQRPCNGDQDCPCSTSTTAISCLGAGTADGVCNFCFADRTECAVGVANCCNSNATCQTVTNSGMSQMQCCVSNGSSCTANEQCCYGAVCGPDSKCGSCIAAGGSATQPTQCCAGLSLVGGVCRVPCINPTTGAAAVAGTACGMSSSPNCNGTVNCDPIAGYECRRPTGLPSTDTTCNGVDDDCDGNVDDNAYLSCTWTGPGTGVGTLCPNGSTVSYPGRRRCAQGSPCMPIGAAQYCRMDTSGNIFGPDACATGYFGTGDCAVGPTFCNAREVCGPVGGTGPSTTVCTGGIPGGACSAAEGCGTNSSGCVPMCRADLAFAGTCWMP
jgi:hypothetical protein